MKFEYTSQFDCDASTLFAYHQAPHAFERLLPPRIKTYVLSRASSLEVGQQARVDIRPLPGVRFRMLAEHVEYDPPRLFVDEQVQGPFAKWRHEHRVDPLPDNRSQLTDAINYELSRFGVIKRIFHDRIDRELHSMFAYRHRVTAADIELKKRLRSEPLRIAVSGGSGMLGKRVVELAAAMGMKLVKLKRVSSTEEVSQFKSKDLEIEETPWHVESGTVKAEDWESVDAFIHLAGANMGDKRWTQNRKNVIRTSRVESTQRLVDFLQRQNVLPKSWVTASGVGIYPHSQDLMSESSQPADDFVGTLARDWESASQRVQEFGSRWCAARLAMVLDPLHGALVPLLWQWKLCLGGVIGNGEFYWSWIERDDAAAALLWLATNPDCHGPYNLSGHSVSFREFATTLSDVLHRPSFFKAPKRIVKSALGEFADGLLLRSNRVTNDKLIDSGYPMRYPELVEALKHLLI
jgi:uncharacterized protein (TIGR01777 family)